MDIKQDIGVKKVLEGDALSKVKELVTYVKSHFKNLDVDDIKENILKNPTYDDFESWSFLHYKDNIAHLTSSCETASDELTEELLCRFPKESQYLLKQESEWRVIYSYHADYDWPHPYVKNLLKEQNLYLDKCDIAREALIFWFSPSSILPTHTDGDDGRPNYSLLVNIKSNDVVKLKVDDRVDNMGLYDAYIFDATNSPHALWNPSDEDWLFICIRLERHLFDS